MNTKEGHFKIGFKRIILRCLRKCTTDKVYYQMRYLLTFKRRLKLKRPDTLMAKIIWQKLYDRAPIYTTLVDKYAVRTYVERTIGAKYLNKLYGVYNNEKEVNFEDLPLQFVLKGTHGANMILICENKSNLNLDIARQKMKKWLQTNFYDLWGEYAYKNVPPRIICEQYLANFNENALVDYKYHCFHGEPKHIQVDRNRFIDHTLNFYDLEWNRLNFGLWYPQSKENLSKPINLDVMTELARKLSKGFKFVRVDFYNIEGKIFFGEMTFYPCNGFGVFTPPEKDFEFGSWINLRG